MNSIGNLFRIEGFGESHGPLIGTVVDGCPAGLLLSEKDINVELKRRRPGFSQITSPRKEPDICRITSGIFRGRTNGGPITVLVENVDPQSSEYEKYRETPRPGHGDFPGLMKYGQSHDLRGGGRLSGRITIHHTVAGAIAKKLLKPHNISVKAKIIHIGGETKNFKETIKKVAEKKDSIGGLIEVIATGLQPGLGEPIFRPLESILSEMIFSVPAVRGIEFGIGFKAAYLKGSQHNDPYVFKNNQVTLETNHCGGVLGGISVGTPLVFRVAIKPTPSIKLKQKTVNLKTKQTVTIQIKGRHDPCIVPRAVPVLEGATWSCLADLLLLAGKIPRVLHETGG